MGSKTLIGGTAYNLMRGKTRINGTGYTIKKGKTLIGGTGYTIALTPLQYSRINQVGTNWPAGSYSTTFTETATSLKAQLQGHPPTVQSFNDRYHIGFAIYADPGATVGLTVSANEGGTYADNHISADTAIHDSDAWNRATFTVTCPTSGAVLVRANNGNPAITSRWIEITRITINGTQVFPTT